MLEPREDQAFRGVVADLLIDDAQFARRIDRLGRPPLKWDVLATLLWMLAPLCVVFGGWTGLIYAVLAAGYGSHLIRKRQRWVAAASKFSAGSPPVSRP